MIVTAFLKDCFFYFGFDFTTNGKMLQANYEMDLPPASFDLLDIRSEKPIMKLDKLTEVLIATR